MKPANGIIERFARLLLENPNRTWIFTGLFALFPLTDWVALTITALVTLRLGWFIGGRCLIAGVSLSICVAQMIGQLPEVLSTTIPAYLLTYVAANLLREWASWEWVAILTIVSSVLIVLGVQGLAPSYMMDQYQAMLSLLNGLDQGNFITKSLGNIDAATHIKLESYFLSIKILGVIFSIMISLTLARSLQSSLYYPGGFRQEMLNFRANSIGVLLLLLTMLGAYYDNSICVSCVPIFFVYLMLAGISLMFNVLANKKKLVLYVALFLPMIVLPYIAFPIYVLFGSIDSIFHLRARWLLQKSE